MSKKILIILIISFLTILGLGFAISRISFVQNLVSKTKLPTEKTLEVEYWGLYTPEVAMKPLIEEYQTKNPEVTIKYVRKQFDNDLERYKRTLIYQLPTPEGPDIFRAHSTWMPELISKISRNQKILSVSDFRKKFFPVAYSECATTGGQIVCIPLMYDGLSLYYNSDILNGAGLNVPKTWEEIRDVAKRLTIRNRDGIQQAGIALGTANNVSYSTDIVAFMMLQSAVSIPKDLNTKAAQAALTFYTDFAQKDEVWDSSMPNSLDAFATQKVAMIIAKSADINQILALNPTLSIEVTTLPQIPNLEGKLTQNAWASFWVESVSSSSSEKEQEEAWKFLNWLSEPDQQMKLYSEISKYQQFSPIYSDKSLANNLSTIDFYSAFIKQAPYSETFILSDRSGNDTYTRIFKDAISMAINGDVEESLSIAKKSLEGLGLK